MGNIALTNLCYNSPYSRKRAPKLIFCDGTTRTLATSKKVVAGEVMFEFPDCMVLHADSFFIGRRIPALEAEDRILPRQTYFVIPIDRLPCNNVLSPASLSGFVSPRSSPRARALKFGDQGPFEYIKGMNGGVAIKVVPEFISRLLNDEDPSSKDRNDYESGGGSPNLLCSTPELKKQYDQLVRPREQVWSPKLETISEYKIRFSPCRFLGLEWKQKEIED